MVGSYNYKILGRFGRKFKINEVQPPLDVREAFSMYAEKADSMDARQLRRLMVEFQGEPDCSELNAEGIIQQVLQKTHHLIKFTKQHGITLDDFFFFLFSTDLNGPIKTQVHHDMTAPFQQYFIYTGHNSYLTGNQISSDCSDMPIIKALQIGVRVIELDLWPSSARDDVNVLHGWCKLVFLLFFMLS